MSDQTQISDDFEPIPAKEARQHIEAAIVARLGEQWQSEWLVVHNDDFLMRLNKGKVNMDFQSDLLGHVEIIEREANPLQISGRFIAFMVLGASFFLALLLANLAGIFN